MMKLKIKKIYYFLAIQLLSLPNSFASSSFVYVPELTGLYEIGSVPDLPEYHNLGLPLATLREANKIVSWDGPGPRYMTYEISGKLIEPTGNQLDSNLINFNGRYVFEPRPGVGWGATLNQNITPSNSTYSYEHIYNRETGEYYFGFTIDVFGSYSNQCCEAWSGQATVYNPMASVFAVFYNYNLPLSGEIFYYDRGAVYIESARIGLSDSLVNLKDYPMDVLSTSDFSSYTPNSSLTPVPVPVPAPLPILGAVAALGWSRKLRRRIKESQALAA